MKNVVRDRKNPVLIALILVTLVSLSGCGEAGVGLQFGQYVAYSPLPNWLVPTAHAAVTEAKLCFKRLRFKTDSSGTTTDPVNDEDNVDFEIGLVTLSSNGTSLGSVDLSGSNEIFRRVEFDLEDGCGTGYSLRITNGNGSFSTNSRVTLKFTGQFDAQGSDRVIEFGVDSLITDLDAVSSSGTLKDAAEGVSGSF